MTARRTVTLLDAARDPHLFAPWFKRAATWQAWFAFLSALFALPMTLEQLVTYRACTARSAPPTSPASEAWLVCGRRAGKSFMLALCAVFLACFRDYRAHLSPGERGTIMVIAADRRQSRVILRYIRALLTRVPMLARMIERETAEAFDLTNAVSIEVATASYRSTRGYTLIAGLLDELAFWPTDDAAEPDYEVLHALRPGKATIPGAMLLCASSPYARRGALWDAHRKHFGKDGDPVLVWQAPTRQMNPTVAQSIIDDALAADPSAAAAEYLAQFRDDVESFVSRDLVDAAIVAGRHELPCLGGAHHVAFVDPSGGSADSMTLAVVHVENAGGADRVVLDLVRERRPPFSPDDVVREFSALLKAYGVSVVRGDRYGGMWPRERFAAHGVEYAVADKPKSDLYRELLPVLNSRRLELLDHPRLAAQLVGLERRTARGGRDSIDHPPGQHDDLANCVAGAVVTALAAHVERVPIVGPLVVDSTGQVVHPSGAALGAAQQGYGEGASSAWRNYVRADGSISMTPRTGGWPWS
jgi:hypothetical protein